MTTVVIPAHNEGMVIGRLLGQLVPAAQTGKIMVIVVANGCTDDTAEIAAAFGPGIRVISVPVASKHEALAIGDAAATTFPRIYLDADVELQAPDVLALVRELRKPGLLAAVPDRVLAPDQIRWPVRWYYDVWLRLPEVRHGLFGRGVIAVNEAGHRRLAGLPPLLADDLAASLSFAPGERSVVPDARVTFHPPRTFGDLLRRRIRAVTGVAQIERARMAQTERPVLAETERARLAETERPVLAETERPGRVPTSAARTRLPDLLRIVRDEPKMAPRVVLFLCVAILSRFRARRAVSRGDYSTWLRDESSRGIPGADCAKTHSPITDPQSMTDQLLSDRSAS